MVYKFFPVFVFSMLSLLPNESKVTQHKLVAYTTTTLEMKVESVYHSLNANNFALPQFACFSNALTGYYQLKENGLFDKELLTVIDFSLSSNIKRLWVIDLSTNTVLFQSLVAHGRNTGEEFATSFSNKASSFKSSLGFYLTGEIYQGKHGNSLKLDGLEKGINDKARERGVVMHAANYVSNLFIKNNNSIYKYCCKKF